MSDLYSEWIVKRKSPSWAFAAKTALIVLTVLLALVSLLGFLVCFILAVAVGCLTYWLSLRWKLEYEYTYVKGELDIDKIMAKSRRKHCVVLDMEHTEIIAPEGAPQLEDYKNTPCKSMDFSSGIEENKKYIMYTSYQNEMVRIVFEPSEKMLEDMWSTSPRKVIK